MVDYSFTVLEDAPQICLYAASLPHGVTSDVTNVNGVLSALGVETDLLSDEGALFSEDSALLAAAMRRALQSSEVQKELARLLDADRAEGEWG